MSRDYFAVFTRLFRTAKFRRLSESAKLTLIYTWAIAGDETPEAAWRDAKTLRDALDLYGRLAEDVDELLAAGFLDEHEGGMVEVHDWDDHQLAASKAIRDAFEASRKRDWRRRPRDEPQAATPPPPPQMDESDHRRADEMRDVRTRPDASGRRPDTGYPPLTSRELSREGWEPAWHAFLDAWEARRLPPLTPRQRDMLYGDDEPGGVIKDCPDLAATWVAEAPEGSTGPVVIQVVLARYNEHRRSAHRHRRSLH